MKPDFLVILLFSVSILDAHEKSSVKEFDLIQLYDYGPSLFSQAKSYSESLAMTNDDSYMELLISHLRICPFYCSNKGLKKFIKVQVSMTHLNN